MNQASVCCGFTLNRAILLQSRNLWGMHPRPSNGPREQVGMNKWVCLSTFWLEHPITIHQSYHFSLLLHHLPVLTLPSPLSSWFLFSFSVLLRASSLPSLPLILCNSVKFVPLPWFDMRCYQLPYDYRKYPMWTSDLQWPIDHTGPVGPWLEHRPLINGHEYFFFSDSHFSTNDSLYDT